MNTYILSFITGGSLYTLINYLSKTIDNKNIVLLASISVLPTSLLSMIYLDDTKLNNICKSYIISILILLLSSISFYYFVKHTPAKKENSILYSIIMSSSFLLLIPKSDSINDFVPVVVSDKFPCN